MSQQRAVIFVCHFLMGMEDESEWVPLEILCDRPLQGRLGDATWGKKKKKEKKKTLL